MKQTDAETYYRLGLAYLGAGDLRSAVAAFRRTVAINPKHAAAQLKLAQMMAASNDATLLRDAQNRLKTLLGSTPATPDILNTLGLAEMKLGDTDQAAQNFERALSQAPGQLSSSIMLAKTKLLQKDPQAAEEILKRAVKVTPNSANAHTILGEFYLSEKRTREAEDEFQRAVGLEHKNGPALPECRFAGAPRFRFRRQYHGICNSGARAFFSRSLRRSVGDLRSHIVEAEFQMRPIVQHFSCYEPTA